jgi:Fe-Mn family superoxide dismutase
MILQCENHQKLTAWGIQPLLVRDDFEHAYYVKYQNKRADYLNQLTSLLNWDNAAIRLQTAQTNRRPS